MNAFYPIKDAQWKLTEAVRSADQKAILVATIELMMVEYALAPDSYTPERLAECVEADATYAIEFAQEYPTPGGQRSIY